jgi:hypothetical protein
MERAQQTLQARVDGVQAPLTLDQIQAALQANGSHPLNLQSLQGTPASLSPTVASTSGGGGSGGGGGGTGGDGGAHGDAQVPMSADPTTAEDQVKRSLAYWGRTDYSYWAGVIHIPSMEPWGPASDGKWYIGWDAYFEARAAPGDTGSTDPSLLPLPAVHQAPVPPGYPTGGWT